VIREYEGRFFPCCRFGQCKIPEFSTHGAGRAMSREKAKKEISMEEFEKSMEASEEQSQLKPSMKPRWLTRI